MGEKFGKNTCQNGSSDANNKKNNDAEKKSVTDRCFCVGNGKKPSECEETAQFMINYVKKTHTRGNAIVEALCTNVKPDTDKQEPKLTTSTAIDEDVMKQMNRQHELKCKM